MKRIFLIILLALTHLLSKAQVTYFPDNGNAWVDGKDKRARLYSVEIKDGKTLVTIELVPTKNLGRLNYWTSERTVVQAANGKVELRIVGFLQTKSGEKRISREPFNGRWGWDKAKEGESYRYTMVFNGIIPPGVTDFALRDRGQNHGFQFWNYKINNPPIGQTHLTTESLIKQAINENPKDPFVGIYDGFAEQRYKLGCVKMNGNYYLLYISDKDKLPWWQVGDLKATLNQSATPGLFKAEWLMVNKSYNDNVVVVFEEGMMKVLINGEEQMYLKMYPSAN